MDTRISVGDIFRALEVNLVITIIEIRQRDDSPKIDANVKYERNFFTSLHTIEITKIEEHLVNPDLYDWTQPSRPLNLY